MYTTCLFFIIETSRSSNDFVVKNGKISAWSSYYSRVGQIYNFYIGPKGTLVNSRTEIGTKRENIKRTVLLEQNSVKNFKRLRFLITVLVVLITVTTSFQYDWFYGFFHGLFRPLFSFPVYQISKSFFTYHFSVPPVHGSFYSFILRGNPETLVLPWGAFRNSLSVR